MMKIEVTSIQILRLVLGFMISVTVAYITASITQSLFVLDGLKGVGADISTSVYLQTIWHDIYGLSWGGYTSYGRNILLAFAVAMPVASLVCHFMKMPKSLIFPLAGSVAMATLLFVVKVNYFYNMDFYAGTRSYFGYLSQLFAGALGGLTFTLITRKSS